MRNELRNSGIEIIGNVPWGTHFCQFYQTEEDLMDILIPYLKAGLEDNELCIWIIPRLTEAKKVKETLKIAVHDIDIYLKRGQIELIPYSTWHLKDGSFDSQRALTGLIERINKSLASGYNGLRLFENICWLEKGNLNEFGNYEKRLDSVIGKYPMIAMCAYCLDPCHVTEVIDIIASHQFILAKKEGKWEQIENSGRRNTTECKQNEQALQESEERYKAIFDNSIDAIFITSPNGTIHAANPAACRMFRMTEEEIIRAGRNGTVDTSDPRLKSMLEERARTGRFKGELNHRRKDGTIFTGEITSSFFKDKNGIVKTIIIIRDITERKQMEKELQESEKKYRNIIETASEGIWMGNSEALTTYVNKRMAEMVGYTQDEMIGRYVWDFTDEENKADIKKKIENRRQGINESYEFKFIRKNDYPLWTIVSSKPLFDNDGKFIGSMSMLTDITKRKEVEAKLKETLDNLENLIKERTVELEKAYKSLKESEKGLAEAQKMAHIGNWEWDIATDKAYWSEEMYRIFRRDPQKLAPSYEEYSNYIHPDDRDIFYNVTKKAEKRKNYSVDYRIVLANGEERTVDMQSEVIFDEKNNPIRVKGIVQDITERKQMEEALRQSEALLSAFLEQLPVGIGLADPQGHWLVTNRILRHFVGDSIPSHDSENSWRWRTWGADGRRIKKSEWPSSRALRGEKVTLGLDFLYAFDDGKDIWTRVSSVPFRNKTGKITGVITVIQDIDEQKRTAEALETAERIRIKEIHHRIKNNLQVISSLLDLQAETFSHLEVCKTPEVVEAFMESQNRVISMALIHEELYKGDKVDTLDFAAYLRKLTEDLLSSYSLGNKDFSFKLDLEQVYLGMDVSIPLGIIVNELVSNSFKHAFPAGKTSEIQINLRRTKISAARNEISFPDENRMTKNEFDYSLEVSDNGKGIPEEIDIENADSLGLQLVNILVEQIDGCIELKRDQGTKFTIWFNDIRV